MSDQSVYFIQAGDRNGPIKIGYSSDVAKRVASIQTGNHLPIRLLATFQHQNAVSIEKRLHERFASDRLEGEWFRATQDLLALIEAVSVIGVPATGTVGPDLAPTPLRLFSLIRESPVRAELNRHSWWVVEWSESGGHAHIAPLLESLSMAHSAYLLGKGEPTDYQIVAIVESADAADELAAKMEPWLKAMREVRRLSETR